MILTGKAFGPPAHSILFPCQILSIKQNPILDIQHERCWIQDVAGLFPPVQQSSLWAQGLCLSIVCEEVFLIVTQILGSVKALGCYPIHAPFMDDAEYYQYDYLYFSLNSFSGRFGRSIYICFMSAALNECSDRSKSPSATTVSETISTIF